MTSLLMRSVLSPLNLASSALSKVSVILSPTLSQQDDQVKSRSVQPSEGYLPVSSLPKLVQQCPSLTDGHFTTSPHLPSGHMQTIYSTLANTVETEAVHYTRRIILLPDGGLLSLDICDNEAESDDPERPTVVILHGLTGGSQESYVRHCVKYLAQRTSEGGPGFRCIVTNFRGCANTPVTSPQLYSAAKTSDIRSALLFITSLYPKSPLIGLGFSLGANILSKYLGEEGDKTPLIGGIACAAPYDLKKGSDLMENHTFRRNVYSRAMYGNLSRLVNRHVATLDLHEPLRESLDNLTDAERGKAIVQQRGSYVANSNKTLKFVDDVITRFAGGHHKPYGEFPFDNSDDYYCSGGAINCLQNLRRPLLSLNADDDPIVAAGSIAGLRRLMGLPPAQDQPEGEDHGHTEYIVLATTHGGGHLGWWEGYRNPTRWLQKPVVDFAKALVSETRHIRQSATAKAIYPGETVKKNVLVELMPASLLPPYIPVSQRNQDVQHSEKSAIDPNDVSLRKGPRLPWLRTHLLEHAPLVHPSTARQGWCGQPPKKTKEFNVDAHGHISGYEDSDQLPEASLGWCAFEAEMVIDAERPEVGFLQLPPWTRVAGAGEVFQGGQTQPGMYGDEDKNDSGIKGL